MTPLLSSLMLDGQRLTDLRKLPNLAALYDLTSPAEVVADTVGRTAFWRDRSAWSSAMCLVLNGVAGNYVSLAALTAFGTGDFTVSAKVVPSALGAVQGVLSSAVNGFAFRIETTGTLLTTKVSVGDNVASTGTISAGSERVITYTRSGTTGIYYIDGVAAGTITDAQNYSVGISFLGASSAAANTINGLLKWARVYSVALSAGAVAADAAGTVQSNNVLNVDFSTATRGATSFVCTTGQTITITTTGSAGARISGARDCYQGTLASQPIFLPWSGTNYGWFPGATGNFWSTPDSAANSFSGDMECRALANVSNWATPAYTIFAGKHVATGNQLSYQFGLTTGGLLQLQYSVNGSVSNTATSAAGTGFAANTDGYVSFTRNSTTGAIVFSASTDGITWAPLGTTGTIVAGALFNSNATLQIGQNNDATVFTSGRIYWVELLNGIGGTRAVYANPAEAVDGALSWVSSTSETWTVNQSGGKPALVVGRASLLTDAVDDLLATAVFTLNQPTTVYLVACAQTWVANNSFFDGKSAVNSGRLQQNIGTPFVLANAGATISGTGVSATLKQFFVHVVVYNSTASSQRLGRTAPLIGDGGTNNMGGLVLGARSDGLAPINARICAFAVFSAAHDRITQDRIIQLLGAQNKLAV